MHFSWVNKNHTICLFREKKNEILEVFSQKIFKHNLGYNNLFFQFSTNQGCSPSQMDFGLTDISVNMVANIQYLISMNI